MNKKLHLLFNHTLTPEQITDAKISLGVTENNILLLPDNMIALWHNIPPEAGLNLSKHLYDLVTYFSHQNKGDYVLVQGDFGAVFYMVNQLMKMDLIPIYATTKRQVTEEKNNENQIITKRIFKHICYRKYIK